MAPAPSWAPAEPPAGMSKQGQLALTERVAQRWGGLWAIFYRFGPPRWNHWLRQRGVGRQLVIGVPYVWLVVRDIETVDPNWSVKGWLDSHGYVRQEDWINEQLTVLNYSRWDKAPVSISPNGVGTESKVFLPHVYRGMEFQTYVVGPGETLLEIALRFDTTVQILMDANQILHPNSISEGQELIVPITGTTDSTSGNPYP